jgi:hypothetical protein
VPCNTAVEEIDFCEFKQRFSPGKNFTNTRFFEEF